MSKYNYIELIDLLPTEVKAEHEYAIKCLSLARAILSTKGLEVNQEDIATVQVLFNKFDSFNCFKEMREIADRVEQEEKNLEAFKDIDFSDFRYKVEGEPVNAKVRVKLCMFTQEDIDKARREGEAEGDRHHYNNGWNDCLYEVNRLKPKCAEYNYLED